MKLRTWTAAQKARQASGAMVDGYHGSRPRCLCASCRAAMPDREAAWQVQVRDLQRHFAKRETVVLPLRTIPR